VDALFFWIMAYTIPDDEFMERSDLDGPEQLLARTEVRPELQNRTATNPTSPVVEQRVGGKTNYWKLVRRFLVTIFAILWIVEAIERSLKTGRSTPYTPSVILPAIIAIGWIIYLIVDVKMSSRKPK
jgi:hypothetical protein